ncbi:MAG: hypothetical protein ABIL09_02520, partial [Gemmatimonadota bacterium]
MRAELRDALEFPFADARVGARPVEAMALDVARGGLISVHLVLESLPAGGKVSLALRQGGRPVTGGRWFRLRHVPVEVNTGPVGFIERDGQTNPYVIRRAPFRVYDAMEPVGASFASVETPTVVRLHLPVPADARAGRRQYVVQVAAGGDRLELGLDVTVHGAVIPPVGGGSLPYTNWFTLDYMATRHGLKPWSDAHWRMVRKYAELMAHGRQNTFWIPLGYVFAARRGVPVLDRPRLRRLVSTFTRAGLHYVEGGHVAGRTGGEWSATTFDTTVVRARATSPEGNAVLAHLGRQLTEEIDRHGWRDRWIQHVTDEPTDSNAVDYRILTGMT